MSNREQSLYSLADFIGSPEAKREEIRRLIEEFVDGGLQHHRTSALDSVEEPALDFPVKALYVALRMSVDNRNESSSGRLDKTLHEMLDRFAYHCMQASTNSRELKLRSESQEVRINEHKQTESSLTAQIVETDRELQAIKLAVALKQQELEEARSEVEHEKGLVAENRSAVSLKKQELEIARSEIEREKGLVAQSRSELALKEQELDNARSEIEHRKGEVAQSQSQLARSQIQLSLTQHQLAESQSRLTQSERQVAQSRLELEAITSVANLKGRRVEELKTVVEERDAQIAKITSSLGWRLLSLYGRIKYPYLLPLYRLFGARPEAGNPRSSPRRT